MEIIVTYNSKTGFTKKYAEWIAEDLGCEVIQESELKNVSAYDVIVHGGWIMGGMISGLDHLRKLNPKKIVAFGVGFTQTENYIETVKEANHVEHIPTFYYVGGINPKKLNFFMKFIVRIATKKVPTFEDYSDRDAIKPLVAYVRNIN